MYDCSVQHAPLTYKFTGKERDSESGLDNFGARYFVSSLGRFMSPDWSASPRRVEQRIGEFPRSKIGTEKCDGVPQPSPRAAVLPSTSPARSPAP